MISMLDIQKARRSIAAQLATALPQTTRNYLEALDAKCLRLLRCELEPATETPTLNFLLSRAAAKA